MELKSLSDLGKQQAVGQLVSINKVLSAGESYTYNSASDFATNRFVPINVIVDASQASQTIVLTFQSLTYTIAAGTVRALPLPGTPNQVYTLTGAGQVVVLFLSGPIPSFEISGSSESVTDTTLESILVSSAVSGGPGIQTYSLPYLARGGSVSPAYAPTNYVSAVQQITGNANGAAFTLTNSTSPSQVVLLEIAISAACQTLPTKSGGIGFSLTQQEEQSAPIIYGTFFVSSTNGGQGKKRITFPGGLVLPAYTTGVGLQMSQYDPEDTGVAAIYGIDFSYTQTLA